MQGDRNKILVDSIKRLLRRDAMHNLKKIVEKTHAADLSRVFDFLTLPDQHKLFQMISDTEQKGVLFSEMEEDTFLRLWKAWNWKRSLRFLRGCPVTMLVISLAGCRKIQPMKSFI